MQNLAIKFFFFFASWILLVLHYPFTYTFYDIEDKMHHLCYTLKCSSTVSLPSENNALHGTKKWIYYEDIMTSSYQDPHDEIVLMVIWTSNTPISLVYGIQFTSLLKIFLEVSHHTIAIEIGVQKGSWKVHWNFVILSCQKREQWVPSYPLQGKKRYLLWYAARERY